jgi:hypothetical protein
LEISQPASAPYNVREKQKWSGRYLFRNQKTVKKPAVNNGTALGDHTGVVNEITPGDARKKTRRPIFSQNKTSFFSKERLKPLSMASLQ